MIEGKVAIVTGGGGGIGEGIVRKLGAKGVKVVATGRNQGKLDRLTESVGNSFALSTIATDITVDDAPFIAVEMNASERDGEQVITFRTNVGDLVEAGPDHPIRFVTAPGNDGIKPYVRVRGRLDALLARPVMYELIAHGEEIAIDGVRMFAVRSRGAVFAIMAADPWTRYRRSVRASASEPRYRSHHASHRAQRLQPSGVDLPRPEARRPRDDPGDFGGLRNFAWASDEGRARAWPARVRGDTAGSQRWADAGQGR